MLLFKYICKYLHTEVCMYIPLKRNIALTHMGGILTDKYIHIC